MPESKTVEIDHVAFFKAFVDVGICEMVVDDDGDVAFEWTEMGRAYIQATARDFLTRHKIKDHSQDDEGDE